MRFREDLLGGRRIACAGGGGVAILGEPASRRASGGWVDSIGDATMADEDGTAAWVSVRTPLRGLVFDAQKCFGTGCPVGCRTPSRAAMENLGRTLSAEWARYAVTAVAVCPGSARTGEELAQLVCFLLSPAAEYMSGLPV